jgi:hypothetical protein
MKIHRDNYEAFLLDMIEGRLSEDQTEDLLRFLNENPDIDVEYEFDNIYLPADDTGFPLKDDLKIGDCGQKITSGNYGQFCIARLEGELSAGRLRELDAFLESNPDCAMEASIYARMRLVPDKSVIFPAKNDLRKKHSFASSGNQPLKRLIYMSASIAAAIAVLISVWLFIPDINDPGVIPAAPSGREAGLPRETGRQSSPAGNGLQAELPVNQHYIHEESIREIIAAKYQPLPEAMVGAVQATEYMEIVREQPLRPAYRTSIGSLRVTSDVETPVLEGATRFTAGINRPPSDDPGPRSAVAGLVASLANIPERPDDHQRLTLSQLARAGLKGLNSLGGNYLLYERKTDPSGERIKVAFSAGPVEFRRSVSLDEE